MLTTTAAWKSAVQRADARLRILVEIYDGTNTWKAVSGCMDANSDLAGTPAAVLNVTPLGGELELVRAKTEHNETHVTVTDAWARPIIVNNRLKGQRVHVYIGTAELDEADFAAFAKHTMIEEIVPKDGAQIDFVCVGQARFLSEAKAIGAYYINTHPLEVLYKGDGSGLLELAGCHTIDTTAFDHTQATYDAIDHLVVGRIDLVGTSQKKKDLTGSARLPDTKIFEDTSSAFTLAEELCTLMGGNLVETEDGEISFVWFDSTAAAQDHWTADDIVPGSLNQTDLDNNTINEIIINYGLDADEKFNRQYHARDTDSRARYAYPGVAARRYGEEFTFDWSGGHYRLGADVTDSQTSIEIGCYDYGALLTGNRSDMTIDASHPVYLLIDSRLQGGTQELVKCTGMTKDTTKNYGMTVWDGSAWVKETGTWAAYVTMTGCTRGYRSTTAQAHDATYSSVDGIYQYCRVFDVTPFVILADKLLDRFADGCPIIECETAMTKFALQRNDLVTIDDSRFVAYGHDGIDSGTKWQIIGKEADPLAKPPRIKWTLALAATNAGAKDADLAAAWTTKELLEYVTSANAATQYAVKTGLGITDAGGLDITVAAGSASNGVTAVTLPAAFTATMPASRDVYVYLAVTVPASPIIVWNDVAIGAASPDTPGNHMVLGVVRTGAASITSIDTTGKPTATLIGSVIIPGTVDSDQLADAAVIAGKIDLDAVTSDHLSTGCVVPDSIAVDAVTTTAIADGAVGADQIAVNSIDTDHIVAAAVAAGKIATGTVGTSELGDLAVTAAKIGAGQIGRHQTTDDSFGRMSNSDFGMWTRETP